jgi:hypothetical protein
LERWFFLGKQPRIGIGTFFIADLCREERTESMAFIGNRQGPRTSDLALQLGPKYFGSSSEQFAREVEDYEEEEARGVVDPVCVDGNGRRFLRFNAPNGGVQRFYLEDHGYRLDGPIQEIPAGEGD